jgi:hypothetical protein
MIKTGNAGEVDCKILNKNFKMFLQDVDTLKTNKNFDC